jgi:glycosyltransferase involved in cell wall biosynthesis
MVVLSPHPCESSRLAGARKHYQEICDSLVYHQFTNLSPSDSAIIKAWHYLTKFPRHGFWSKQAEEVLKQEIARIGADVVWCNATWDAKYLPVAKRNGCATVLTTHNVESDVLAKEPEQSPGASWRQKIRTLDVKRLEKFGARYADAVTAMTDLDVAYYQRLRSGRGVFLLSMTVPVQTAQPSGNAAEEPNMICFIGSMDWPPNVWAAQHLVRNVMPLIWKVSPAAKCFLVGRNPTPAVQQLAGESVVVTGSVPSVQDYYERASVIVVPVRDVGGIKIKMIEAMAAGKAIVTTTAGRAGLNVRDGEHVLIADDAQAFAHGVASLLGSEARRQELGRAARQFVQRELAPAVAQKQVARVLAHLPLRGRTAAPRLAESI